MCHTLRAMSLFQEIVLKVHLIFGGHFENCSAIFVAGQISDVPIANNVLKVYSDCVQSFMLLS